MSFIVRKAFKYRIYPTKAQITNLENQFSMCRHLYNNALGERKSAYEQTGETITYRMQQNQLPQLKIERPWYKGVYSQVLQDVLKRLDNGYKSFFRRVNEGTQDPGFPRFKKRGEWTSITYPQYSAAPCDQIVVPKVGTIKTIYHRQLPDKAQVKTLTISREGCKWFACFSFELPLDSEPKPDLQHPIGIDLGLIDFVYDSDGFSELAPRYLRRSLDKLARLQRRFAAARERSPKWNKLLRAIQKRHYKIRCQRNDFLHKLANFLLEKSDLVFHEKLNIKGMSRRPKPVQGENGEYVPNGAAAKAGLNKSISDAGWRQFLLFLGYKAVELGKRAIGVPAHYTSQRCSQCKQIVRKSLSVRTHRCPFCGFVAPRDYNSALEILALGLKSLTASAV